MKVILIAVMTVMVLSGCGHYRQTMLVNVECSTRDMPTKRYRIAAVKELFKGEDILARWSGNDEASASVRAFYKQRERDFIHHMCSCYPDVFTEDGEALTIVLNNDSQKLQLGVGGVLNIIVSIPTLLTIPIFYDSEWSREVTVLLEGRKSSPTTVTEHVEMRQTGPIAIALCFPYSVLPVDFCVTGIKTNNDRTEAMKINEGKAIGRVVVKQLVELERIGGAEKPRGTRSSKSNIPSVEHTENGESHTNKDAGVVEIETIPL